jgi:hypothetical protein
MTTVRRGAAAALLLCGLPLGPASAAPTADDPADAARAVLQKHCESCHGAPAKQPREEGLSVLDRDLLLTRKLVRPNDPGGSELFVLADCGTMPPGALPKLSPGDRTALRDWIAAGAPPFSGDPYVLRVIARDLAAQKADDFPYLRYVSFNHLLNQPGAPGPEECGDALAAAVNHLSSKPDPVRPAAVDAGRTVFRLDLRQLGWDATPYQAVKPGNRANSPFKLYDLVLLEYPFEPLRGPLDGPLAAYLTAAFPPPARPVLYVQGDWLVAAATQPPLYPDLLRLPQTLKGLEDRLKAGGAAPDRGGFTDSAVAAGARLAERRATAAGAYWRTYELAPLKDKKDLLMHAGDSDLPGLALFTLPNGLNGYYAAGRVVNEDKAGQPVGEARLADAADWVKDPQAPDRGARLGLACVRCHAHGVKDFTDAVGPALDGLPPAQAQPLKKLYPGQAAVAAALAGDRDRYDKALRAVYDGRAPGGDPLASVADFFLKSPRAAPLTAPPGKDAPPTLLPLDALTVPRFQPAPGSGPGAVSFRAIRVDVTPEKPDVTEYALGQRFVIEVSNDGDKDIYFELIRDAPTKPNGQPEERRRFPAVSLTPLGPRKQFRYPADLKEGPNPKKSLTINLPTVPSQYVLYASDAKFPDGVWLMRKNPGDDDVGERVVHPFYGWSAEKGVEVAFDPARVFKKTLVVQTREK